MPIKIPRSLVEFILLGPEDDRRQLQDSPILGDVWVEFARDPGAPLELLITPYKEQAAGTVAAALSDCTDIKDADVAYLQGIIAARLTFEEVLRFVVPMTFWWNDKRIAGTIRKYQDSAEMEKVIAHLLDAAGRWQTKQNEAPMQDVETAKRYIALAGLILWARGEKQPKGWEQLGSQEQISRILKKPKLAGRIAAELAKAFQMTGTKEKGGLVWTISLNRRAAPALSKSVPAVKADAARTLFTVRCADIVWAVIDSGIDATHPAFAGPNKTCRIRKSFDFTTIREIVSLDNSTNPEKRRIRIDALLSRALKTPLTKEKAAKDLQKLADGARQGRSINWELVEPLVEIDPAKCEPATNHGTHVAGILGAARQPAQPPSPVPNPPEEDTDWVDGMCPDILIYDFRVLAPTLRETEFAIIAALQYIRYINERNSYMTIHGANLSLSIPHDVRNYACGRTPVCNECERLVNSGVVGRRRQPRLSEFRN
jgi:serine protease AprX